MGCGMSRCFKDDVAESSPQEKPGESTEHSIVADNVPVQGTNGGSVHDENGVNGKHTFDTPKKSSDGNVKRTPSKLQKRNRPRSSVASVTGGKTEPLSTDGGGEMSEKGNLDAAIGTGAVVGAGTGIGAGAVGLSNDRTDETTNYINAPVKDEKEANGDPSTMPSEPNTTIAAAEPTTPSTRTYHITNQTESGKPATIEDNTELPATTPVPVSKPPVMPLTPMTEVEEPEPKFESEQQPPIPQGQHETPQHNIPEPQTASVPTTTTSTIISTPTPAITPLKTTQPIPPTNDNTNDIDTPINTPIARPPQPFTDPNTTELEDSYTPTPRGPTTTLTTSGIDTPTYIPGSASGDITPNAYSGDVTPHAGTGDVTPTAGVATSVAILGGAGLANLQNLKVPRRPSFDERSMTDESVYYSVKSFAT